MEVELRHQTLLDVSLDIGTEEESIGEDDRRPPVLPQTVHDKNDEQVGSLVAAEVHREVVLDDVLF